MQQDPKPQAKPSLTPKKSPKSKSSQLKIRLRWHFHQCSPCYFHQGSRTRGHILWSVRKRWICAAPHGRAPPTLVVWVKPESRQADKMWNSWRGREGKFQTSLRTCGGSGGVVMFSCPGPSKLNRGFFNVQCLFKFKIYFIIHTSKIELNLNDSN